MVRRPARFVGCAMRNLFIGFIAATVVFMVLVTGGTLMYLDYVSARDRAEEERAREKEPPAPRREASGDPAEWKRGDHIKLGGEYVDTLAEAGAYLDSLEGKGIVNRWVVRIKVGAAEVHCATKEVPAAPVFQPGQRVSVSGEFQFRNGHVVVMKECEFR